MGSKYIIAVSDSADDTHDEIIHAPNGAMENSFKTIRSATCTVCHTDSVPCFAFDFDVYRGDEYADYTVSTIHICSICLRRGSRATKLHMSKHISAIQQADELAKHIGSPVKCIKYSGDVVEGEISKVKDRVIWVIREGNQRETKVDLIEVESLECDSD